MERIFRRGAALWLAVLTLFGAAALRAQTSAAPDDSGSYVAPAGSAPPVAPPLSPTSPLYHLAHDPKYTAPVIGYREGDTQGVPYGYGHRCVDVDGGEGWGWVRRSNESWGHGRWVALQESPGLVIAPHRHLVSAEADNDWEFQFWGYFATYRAYDPHLDELLPVFVLRGYQVVGLASPLHNKIGPPGRISHLPSGASSRMSSPILSDPGVD
jgi:hypothetical protein